MKTCNNQLNDDYIIEQNRVKLIEKNNQYFYQQFHNSINNCSISYMDSNKALKSWSSVDLEQSIMFYKNCTINQRNQVKSIIGDASASSDSVIIASQDYTRSSDNTVFKLVDYTNSLSTYNELYLYNKTKNLKLLEEEVAFILINHKSLYIIYIKVLKSLSCYLL